MGKISGPRHIIIIWTPGSQEYQYDLWFSSKYSVSTVYNLPPYAVNIGLKFKIGNIRTTYFYRRAH